MRRGPSNLEVYIKSDGRELPEYLVETVDDKTLACYIPSEVGKTFEICWRGDTTHDSHMTWLKFYVDGQHAGGAVSRLRAVEDSYWGIRCAKNQRKPYTFASLATTDDDAIGVSSEARPGLGTIEVRLAHVIKLGSSQARSNDSTDKFKLGIVHEKSKKMGMQCVSLGDARKCDNLRKQPVKLVNAQEPFYSCFIFRYRCKDFLQAEGILPLDDRPERKRRINRSPSNAAEAGPSHKRARVTTISATSTAPHEDDQLSPAHSAEDIDAIQKELNSAQGRVQALMGKLQAMERSGSSSIVKKERLDLDEDSITSTHDNIKKECPIVGLDIHGSVIDLTLDEE
ncbi:uncharacterized protein B0H18DRAFT_981918 [Fomitopsis serialis]|uniref:uncharacterized protein n=1 Tax=Fomitopsis serialis TaxID=139415 RepID=UPI002007FCCD|nr:uncharacterized protein B0H18DRAFT_981918 [Neoantrodia serialis]KAH9933765.1 hypothetical protein B0H18DRAFT_981918 [Neoantrodia serialis]